MERKDSTDTARARIPHWRQVFDQAGVTPEVRAWKYSGSGTEKDPHAVTWIDDDPRNPKLYPALRKWSIALFLGLTAFGVAFDSSAFSGCAVQIIEEFGCSREVYTLGISLFVLGFAIGPLLWAPLSERIGRQYVFISTFFCFAAFNAAAAASQDIWTLLILRFLTGSIGSSAFTSPSAVAADMFTPQERGLAIWFVAATIFLGPCFGPMIGGFVGSSIGWRWLEGIMAIYSGVLWMIGSFLLPETYAPVLLRQRAKKLSRMTGLVYKSRGDILGRSRALSNKDILLRPLKLLLLEPIVLILCVYQSIVYGTLYLCFAAFPIVYQEKRGWSAGIGGLPFLGVAVGMFLSFGPILWQNKIYSRVSSEHSGFAPPEARLPMCMIGAVAAPLGLFWFAWTNYPSIDFMVPIIAGVPFGFSLVLIFLGTINYLVDSYEIYAASVVASTAVLRSIFGAVFPLFTTQMFQNLGIHWAASIPAFLALACVPFPFLLYKYGPAIRTRCKYAAECKALKEQMQSQVKDDQHQAYNSAGAKERTGESDGKSPGELDGEQMVPNRLVENHEAILEDESK